jgi:hypothetical protein
MADQSRLAIAAIRNHFDDLEDFIDTLPSSEEQPIKK